MGLGENTVSSEALKKVALETSERHIAKCSHPICGVRPTVAPEVRH